MSQAVAITSPNAPTPAIMPSAGNAGSIAAPRSGFSFHDFLNIINPLQHIPVVGTIYRELTGDTMKPISNILGGALFGGVIGLAASGVDSIVEEVTGKDVGAHVLATLGLHHDKNAAPQLAAGSTKTHAATAAKPVPAFLVTEAALDAAKRAGASNGQVSDFFRNQQHRGTGGGAGKPVVTIGPPRGPAASSMAPAQPGATNTSVHSWLDSFPKLKAEADAAGAGSTQPVQPAAPVAAASPVARAQDLAAAQATGSAQSTSNVTAADAAPAAPKPLPSGEIPGMMMQALAKYEAMRKAQQAPSVDQIH